VSSDELASGTVFRWEGLRAETPVRAITRFLGTLYLPSGLLLFFGLGDPLCGFSMRVFGHLKIMESKHKARDHTFNSEGWALPGVVLLEVALSCFLLCNVAFIYWRYV
jgi:hypothetical protein